MTELGPVVVVGDVMVDILVQLAGPLRRGTDQNAEIAMLPGGSGANQAAWLAACGEPVRLAARVGAADVDRLGREFVADGVTPFLAADPERPTGTLVCVVERDGERSFLTSRGANAALCVADLPDALLDGAGQVHVSGYALFEAEARAAVVDLFARARKRGIPTSIDPGSSGFLSDLGPAVFLAAAAGADTILPNRDEAEVLTGESDPERQLTRLATLFETVVLKQGAAGAIVATAQARVTRAAMATDVVDTTGAGDAFLAGWLSGLRSSGSRDVALDTALRLAALAVARTGGRPPKGLRDQGLEPKP